jgi:arylformamidase
MPVYPGDPEVHDHEIHTLKKEGWRLRELQLTTHIGTHVNVRFHMVQDGKKLDSYSLERFMGEAVIYSTGTKFDPEIGVIFRDQNIDQTIAKEIIRSKPKFVGLSVNYQFDIEIEKQLLEKDIISYEYLVNLDKCPARIMFYGIPLHIQGADGSPVRAFGIVE